MSFLEIDKCEKRNNFNMSEFQSHDFFELYFLLDGTRNVFVENKLFLLSKNCMCVIPPYSIHKTEGSVYSRINLYISGGLLSDTEKKFLLELAKNVAFSLTEPQMQFIVSLLSEANAIEVNNSKTRLDYQLSFSKTLLSYLSLQPLTPLSSASITPTQEHIDSTVLKMAAYINEHFQEKISLDLMSEEFFLSKNTLCKRFQKTMHTSVIQYAIYVRLTKAKLYLTTTKKSMEDIAELCGFPSANYFSLIFKKHFGISPIAYRKKL